MVESAIVPGKYKLLFAGKPRLIDCDGVLVHEFSKKDSQFDIARWLCWNGYDEDNMEIPDVRYHGIFLSIINLQLFRGSSFNRLPDEDWIK